MSTPSKACRNCGGTEFFAGNTARTVTVTLLATAAFLAGSVLKVAGSSAPSERTDVFVSGQGGYRTYRIPALIVSSNRTLLAFCEGRKNGPSDTGAIDLLLK